MELKQLTIKLPVAMYEWIERMAKDEMRPVSFQIVFMLKEAYDQAGAPGEEAPQPEELEPAGSVADRLRQRQRAALIPEQPD